MSRPIIPQLSCLSSPRRDCSSFLHSATDEPIDERLEVSKRSDETEVIEGVACSGAEFRLDSWFVDAGVAFPFSVAAFTFDVVFVVESMVIVYQGDVNAACLFVVLTYLVKTFPFLAFYEKYLL